MSVSSSGGVTPYQPNLISEFSAVDFFKTGTVAVVAAVALFVFTASAAAATVVGLGTLLALRQIVVVTNRAHNATENFQKERSEFSSAARTKETEHAQALALVNDQLSALTNSVDTLWIGAGEPKQSTGAECTTSSEKAAAAHAHFSGELHSANQSLTEVLQAVSNRTTLAGDDAFATTWNAVLAELNAPKPDTAALLADVTALVAYINNQEGEFPDAQTEEVKELARDVQQLVANLGQQTELAKRAQERGLELQGVVNSLNVVVARNQNFERMEMGAREGLPAELGGILAVLDQLHEEIDRLGLDATQLSDGSDASDGEDLDQTASSDV